MSADDDTLQSIAKSLSSTTYKIQIYKKSYEQKQNLLFIVAESRFWHKLNQNLPEKTQPVPNP